MIKPYLPISRSIGMQSAALEDQIQVIYGEITEYENLKDGKVRITIVGGSRQSSTPTYSLIQEPINLPNSFMDSTVI